MLGIMSKRPGGTRLDPSANDRWWRDRIAKEEQSLHCGDPQSRSGNHQSYTINTLGNLQSVPKAAENHLVGVGAVVRGGKNQFQDPDSYMPTGAGRSKPPGSTIGGRYTKGSDAGSNAPSRAKSTSTITSTAVLTRLERLEQELMGERKRREAAENEMRELLSRSQGSAQP